MAKKERHLDIMKLLGYLFTSIPESEITQPHLPPGFWGIENPLKSLSRKPPTP